MTVENGLEETLKRVMSDRMLLERMVLFGAKDTRLSDEKALIAKISLSEIHTRYPGSVVIVQCIGVEVFATLPAESRLQIQRPCLS
jgi:hypothetical protein